jgi:hypothetical protein
MPVTKKVDMTMWLANYRQGTSTAGAKLVAKFSSRQGIVAAATSDAAVALMKAKVVSDLAIKKRAFKLNRQGDAGLIAAMQKSGATNYQTRTAQAAQKAATGFTPFAPIMDSIVAGLPARTSDPAQNVQNRVTPIAVGMQNAAKALYGAQ